MNLPLRCGKLWLFLAFLCAATSCKTRDGWLAQLQDSRPEMRTAAIAHLAQQVSADDVVLFSQSAKDPVASVRAEAALALGRTTDPRVVDLLGELLGDGDQRVQQNAALALAQTHSDRAKQYLLSQYARRNRATREAIVHALETANVPGAMAAAVAAEANQIWTQNLDALNNGTLPEKVGAALELGRSGRPEAVTRLVALLRESQVLVSAAALRGLGKTRDPKAVAVLLPYAKENASELREAACEALGELADLDAVPALLEVAKEDSPVSVAATSALAKLPADAEVNQALCRVVYEGRGNQVEVAALAAHERGGCAVGPLIDQLKQTSTVRPALRAIRALGMPLTGANASFETLWKDADLTIRAGAVDVARLSDKPDLNVWLGQAWEQELKRLEPLLADWVKSEKGTTDQIELADDVSDDQYVVLASLMRALAERRVPSWQDKVRPYLHSDSVMLRSAAYQAWAGADVVLAQHGLLDGDPSVQRSTAVAMARAGEPGIKMLLRSLAAVPDRSLILDVLQGHAIPSDALEMLDPVLQSGGADAALTARLLGTSKNKANVPVLLSVLKMPGDVVEREALSALGTLGAVSARAEVGKWLNHENPEVRLAALETLRNLGNEETNLAAVDALKGDYDVRIRSLAKTIFTKLKSEPKP